MTSIRDQKKTAKKAAAEAAARKKVPAKKKAKPAPAKTVEGRTRRKLSAEKLGLTKNPDQKIPTVYSAPLDLGLSKSRTSGFNVISDGTVTLNHAKALEYIDLPVFEGERAAGDMHVNHLLDLVHSKEFNWYSVQLATAEFDGQLWKVNGQHCAWLVLYLASNFSCEVRETVYKARDAAELGRIYRTYDVGKPRDMAHQMKGALVLAEAAPGVPSGKLVQLSNGFRFWKFESEREASRVTVDQQVALAAAEKDLFVQVGLFGSDAWKESRFMLRKPVVAAMFETFGKVSTKAPEFWYPVASGLQLKAKTDPKNKLRGDLEKKYVRPNGIRSTEMKANMSDEQVYRICIQAWNKWRKGEPVHVLKPTKTRVRAI